MAIYDVEIGDWSGDGHGRVDKYYLQVSDNVTREDLNNAYLANAKLFGFSPSDFAKEYEDASMPAVWLDALFAAGFTITDPYWDPAEISDSGSNYYINSHIMFEIAAFFFTHGLPSGTVASEYVVPSTNILGHAGINNDARLGNDSSFVGYGVTSY